ncbi:MAG: OmpA family protein [Schleiferiaceae bacterium]|nr:OmpA family protein [Schleiferiaceae bacterium]MDR9441491.1 OmpA family protein [Schleiferiaceae bacterium]
MMIRMILLLAVLVTFGRQAEAQNRRAKRNYEKAQKDMRAKNYTDALGHLYESIEHSPEYVAPYLLMARIYGERRQRDSAAAVLKRARPHGLPYYALFTLGKLLIGTGEYGEAEEVLQQYREHPQSSQRYREEAQRMLEKVGFAREAVKNPVPYEPQNLGPEVNTPHMEYFPSVVGDGNTLVYTHRQMEGPRDKRDEDFWITQRDSAGAPWRKGHRMQGYLNSAGNEGAQTITADGQVIFFAGCNRPDGLGSCDIYVSIRQENGDWGRPHNLGKRINSGLWESQPSISADGKTLYFVRGKTSRDKAMDIYYSRLKEGRWTPAAKLPGAVNTPGQETSPFIHFDDQHLYFSSNTHPGMGDLDFFVSTRQADGSWGEPKNLGYPINTAAEEFSLVVAPNGTTGYFSSDALESTQGMLDLYSFQLPAERRAKPVAYLQGQVVNQKTQAPLQARISFVNLRDSTHQFSRTSTRQGQFYAVLPVEEVYALSIAKEGYLFYSRYFTLSDSNRRQARRLKVELVPIEAGQKVKLENVFFAFDSYELESRSYAELNKVAQFLKQNKAVFAVLEGHTDSEGSAAYNKELSQQRAKAVYEYLIAQGVNPERLKYEGYGASQPVASNDTEEGRALNRRTELRIEAYK